MEEDEEEQYLNEIVLSYKKYRAIPPFIRTKSKKNEGEGKKEYIRI